jgi:hypothetical protein
MKVLTASVSRTLGVCARPVSGLLNSQDCEPVPVGMIIETEQGSKLTSPRSDMTGSPGFFPRGHVTPSTAVITAAGAASSFR